jgi:transglutaminase-like putative cysteine protease
MNFKISHTTEYLYSDDIFFEPHFFRFKPKISTYCSIVDYNIAVEPKPAGFSEQLDTENNHIGLYWFENTHNKLRIEVNSIINVAELNPFNFLVHPEGYLKLPFVYNKHDKELLKPAMQARALSEPMLQFLKESLKKAKHQTIPFLTEITRLIHSEFSLENRELGEPFEASHTFRRRNGSCRDLAWMQIQLFRQVGIAARFVSGYFYVAAKNPTFELHAWVEVYLPGAGWIGFDPSHGMITGHYHIPLASSAFYENTMPVSGSIRGDATATMENYLNITMVS